MPLYRYQEQVKQHLLAGRSVILQAPTGAGKTRAALAPFIESFFTRPAEAFPRKCIYSVPMRVLANQFVAEYKKMAGEYARQFRERQLDVRIQTGDRPDDPQFEGDLIFTTIDQTLSSFLNIPYGLGKRRANLNAGAVSSSYLVFDELHLYDPDTTLGTTLQMLQMLRGVVPFVIMTATFSSTMLEDLGRLLNAVVVPNTADSRLEMETIGSQVGKDRRFLAIDTPLTAEAVLAYDVPRTLCICNTVRSAQTLYEQLKTTLTATGALAQADIHLLHSRFYKADRDAKEDWIRDQFGIRQSDYHGRKLIQIATQVIEVGVDATCDVLHTELAPASSLLQRGGRCARRDNEHGRVFVYLPRNDQGEPYYLPYGRDPRSLQLCEKTWDALQRPQFSDTHMSFRREQALIDAVHQPIDQAILADLQQGRSIRHGALLDAMRDYSKGLSLIPNLIRDVNNRFVFIHSSPQTDDLLQTNPWSYDGFALFPQTIAGAFAQLGGSYRFWGMKAVDDDEAPSGRHTYAWYPLTSAADVYGSPVLAVSPELACYDPEIGFRFAETELPDAELERFRSPLRVRQVTRKSFSYLEETFAEHVAGLYKAYKDGIDHGRERHNPIRDDFAYVISRIEANPAFQLTPGMIDQMCQAIFVAHDLGKLNQAWQAWAHCWHQQVDRFYEEDLILPADYMAAHTRYDPREAAQREAQKKLKIKRPPHAGESAIAALSILEEICGQNEALFCAAFQAIACHHTPSVSSHQSFRMHRAAGAAVRDALRIAGLSPDFESIVPDQIDQEEIVTTFLSDVSIFEHRLFYHLLVRILRLADQRSQL